jgi:hypothetical protein
MYCMNAVSIRQAEVKDLDAMLEVWRVSDEDAGDGRRRELVKALAFAPDLVVVAEADDQIVGVIVGTTDGLFGYLKRLIVRPTGCWTGFDQLYRSRFLGHARGISR